MEKAKKSVEQMAKEANGRSRACVNCSLFMNCNMITQKICSDAFMNCVTKTHRSLAYWDVRHYP